ncbi:hypothetical protein [Paraburkholderia lacunae]|uniref:Uncharacterized protein n=1 Tax=Paraburkholderia lacunae TaxID=2211104 RepID=A0A370N581_9BURK|nr:hypothetical protein [Paraburkholderia lacunae]RDK00705.1 hypothetical protein DLM46_22350 [Paraburkholderia lacunae]
MYTKANANIMKNWVRDFFDGPEHSGMKSDNKRYDAPPVEGVTLKEGQAERRNTNQPLAATIRQTIHGKKQAIVELTGKAPTPAEMGAMIKKHQLRGGNCAEMTWLLCFAFKSRSLNIWIAIIDDPGDHQFCILMKNKPGFGSIKTMDYSGDDQWIIDPWANIVCKPAEFFTAFGDKMKKWTDRGKRIGVPNSTRTGYVWTPGTDAKYFKDNTESGLLYRKGWDFPT